MDDSQLFRMIISVKSKKTKKPIVVHDNIVGIEEMFVSLAASLYRSSDSDYLSCVETAHNEVMDMEERGLWVYTGIGSGVLTIIKEDVPVLH